MRQHIFQVSEWEIGPRGLIFDRTWMVVSENGVPLGQKREPRLCLLRPVIHLDSRTLELSFPGPVLFFLSFLLSSVIAGLKDLSLNLLTCKRDLLYRG